MMKADPGGPLFKILKWEPGPHRPSKRLLLQTDAFKVTRTYSLTSTLSRHAASGVRIRNNVFSDMPAGATFTWETCETISAEPMPWRVGYYDKPRSWEEKGPEPGDVNSVTRRFLDQKTFKAARMPSARPSFLQACSAKALSLRKNAAKQKRKLRLLRGDAPSDMSSSSSSSSSSSNSNSSDNESDESSASQWSHP